jgi:hypothetical protein
MGFSLNRIVPLGVSDMTSSTIKVCCGSNFRMDECELHRAGESRQTREGRLFRLCCPKQTLCESACTCGAGKKSGQRGATCKWAVVAGLPLALEVTVLAAALLHSLKAHQRA